MNNFRLRYNPLQNNNTDIDLALQTPILTTWDLNGVNESIDVFENEIIQKAITAGISGIVAVSAPTSLAVETARAFGLTLLGFARNGEATQYN